MPTKVNEKSLENIIVNYLVENNGFLLGDNSFYEKKYAIDTKLLFDFLLSTQKEKIDKLNLGVEINREKFLVRLVGETEKRGIVDVLRNGIQYYPVALDMYYETPSNVNDKAKELYNSNIFSVTRQLRYSEDNTKLALDFAVFLNGLPIMTFELKNQYTKQTVSDAVEQYKNDRDSKDLIFHFAKCMVHFAVDTDFVKMCTKLEGKHSYFLPFDKGNNNGAGNPVNPNGLRTDYLWKQILTKAELSNIIENYAQKIEIEDKKKKTKKYVQIFPRYHQLDVVKKLLEHAKENGVGNKYLIQHSAGSGKSNSIAWLVHQLVGLEKNNLPIFDSIIIVTDRINLDKQLKNTVKLFAQLGNIVGHADKSGDLKELLSSGKKIIITTVHKFQYIYSEVGTEHKNSNFAIVIDEAHSSQSGNMSAKMNVALSGNYEENEENNAEDIINSLVESRKMLNNASYFAFTATPKNKTLEMFGVPVPSGDKVKFLPFHSYTMKQAIQEGFILDVLQNYTTVNCYYKLAKTVEDDPKFDVKKAQKKLRKYVESNEYAISKKAEIIVEHFHSQVINKGKINGQARAMVVCSSIERAIEYFYALEDSLKARKSQYKCIIAFSGEKTYNGQVLTESIINGFASSLIEDTLKNDPYRILVVANKFQTGYDEPLLHTMYVDKILTDISAVQTLSRLNRAIKGKTDTFVLDFANDTEAIKQAFDTYYKTTILSDQTDPNKLFDLQNEINSHNVFTSPELENVVNNFVSNESREKIDAIIDSCVERYKELNEEGQVKFKGSAKAFVRTHNFLAAILPIGKADWEKLCIFLTLLITKLPTPREDDLSDGIINAIDLDSYRAEVQAKQRIVLEDEDHEIEPIPVGAPLGVKDVEIDYLTHILDSFHSIWGNIDWKNEDTIKKTIPIIIDAVSRNQAYKNAIINNDESTARIESDQALKKAVSDMMYDNVELYKQFIDNPQFARWLAEVVFTSTYEKESNR